MSADLYTPDRDEFCDLAARHAVVPVWREVLADLQTPLGVYDRLRDEPGPTFLLESVERGERWGRYSFIGLAPFCTLTARDGEVHLDGSVPPRARAAAATEDALTVLETLVDELRTPELPGLPPLFAGAVGYLGYDVVRLIESLPGGGVDDLGLADARLVFPGHVLAFDHLRQRLLVITNVVTGGDPATGDPATGDPGAGYDAAVADAERLVARLGEPAASPPLAPPTAARVTDADANMDRAAYLDAVDRCKAYIRTGDAYQVVASQRFALTTRADPLAVYRVLRVVNPSPYLYLFDLGDTQVVGSSPEALVTVRGDRASIWPLAGSRPRGADDEEDAKLEASLLADDKERAEHVMLVDLARNDLGRVCELGSVTVEDFMSVVRYSHVMHLSSRVTGRIRPGVGAVDVFRATFPAGTLTGAPKVRAMEIIDELEPTRRGVYGGGIGYVDLAGNLDLCIAIRTLVFTGGRAYVQAGAGVVADSVPEREYEETVNKAMALLAAVRAAERLDHTGASP